METVLEVRKLNKFFGSKQALNDVDFSVRRGDIVGYIGPNGSGKSTTLKVILGLISDYYGEVELFGKNIKESGVEYKKKIGYVPEISDIYDSLTAYEYLSFLSKVYELDTEEYIRKGVTMLRAFGMREGDIHQRIESFSKGMKQKLVIVSSMIHNPDILFLDEPLNGLDANSVSVFKDVISGLAQRGKTVFYSSHLMEVVEKVSNRIILLKEGRVLADKTMEELAEYSEDKSLELIFSQLTGFEQKGSLVEEYLNSVLGDER